MRARDLIAHSAVSSRKVVLPRLPIDMDQITVRLPEGLIAELDAEAENGQYDSRTDRIRDILESRTEVDELRQEVERLRRERRQILEQRTENQELVAFADQQRSVIERQEARGFHSIHVFGRARRARRIESLTTTSQMVRIVLG